MMREFLLYYKGILFGGIYDDRLLIKKLDSDKKYNMREQIPYDSTKTMYLFDDTENKKILKEIILDTYSGLLKKVIRQTYFIFVFYLYKIY